MRDVLVLSLVLVILLLVLSQADAFAAFATRLSEFFVSIVKGVQQIGE